jgi:hypothetical protein
MKKNKQANIFVLGALILVLMLCVTGATYAYFAISASNNNVITGTAASVSMDLQVSRVIPAASNTNPLVPQLSVNTSKGTNALGAAISGGCVDSNNNVTCHVYRISVQNKSTARLRLIETLTLSGGTYTNLKWYTLATANDSTSLPTSVTYSYPSTFTAKYGNAKSVTSLGDSQQLSVNNYRYFYVVVWIEETGSDQNTIDLGTYTGTVNVNAVDTSGAVINGVTSTFTG